MFLFSEIAISGNCENILSSRGCSSLKEVEPTLSVGLRDVIKITLAKRNNIMFYTRVNECETLNGVIAYKPPHY